MPLPIDSASGNFCSGAEPRSRGFTLIEIVVALALIGLLMGVAVGQMDRVFELEMKKTSNKLASTIRYLYNKAAMEKLYIRLVFDFEEQSYWVEATADPVVVVREDASTFAPKEGEKSGEGEEEPAESAEASAEEAPTEEGGVQKLKAPEPKFGAVDSFLLRPTKLPDSVFFKDLYVEHRQGAVEGGKESIYFFPNGYVEKAVINLRDEEDEVHYSLATNPINGRVSIEPEYRSLGGR